MAGERIDYTAAAVEAARSVLIELTHILGEHRDDMVVVGGWIPELLIPQSQERHVGSIDVDLALNHKELTEAGYRMIGEILLQHGYAQDKEQPFVFRKPVRGQVVQVDFLAGEYGGTGKSRRTLAEAIPIINGHFPARTGKPGRLIGSMASPDRGGAGVRRLGQARSTNFSDEPRIVNRRAEVQNRKSLC